MSLATTAPVTQLAWDKDGDCLAILQEGQGLVPIWDMQYREVTRLDTALKEPTYMTWSKTGPQLVVGNSRGNVLVYNRQSRKKVSVLGKHPRKITCGCWSQKDNKLALGSDDCTLTVSNEIGDTLEQTELKHAPCEMCFATQKTSASQRNDPDAPETHISINMGGKSRPPCAGHTRSRLRDRLVRNGRARSFETTTPAAKTVFVPIAERRGRRWQSTAAKLIRSGLRVYRRETRSRRPRAGLLLYDLKDAENPLELAFQQRYGNIVRHQWFGDGFMMLGFSEGFLVVISTHISEIGEELFSGRFHHKQLHDVAYVNRAESFL